MSGINCGELSKKKLCAQDYKPLYNDYGHSEHYEYFRANVSVII